MLMLYIKSYINIFFLHCFLSCRPGQMSEILACIVHILCLTKEHTHLTVFHYLTCIFGISCGAAFFQICRFALYSHDLYCPHPSLYSAAATPIIINCRLPYLSLSLSLSLSLFVLFSDSRVNASCVAKQTHSVCQVGQAVLNYCSNIV
jgi:hypothetical protein